VTLQCQRGLCTNTSLSFTVSGSPASQEGPGRRAGERPGVWEEIGMKTSFFSKEVFRVGTSSARALQQRGPSAWEAPHLWQSIFSVFKAIKFNWRLVAWNCSLRFILFKKKKYVAGSVKSCWFNQGFRKWRGCFNLGYLCISCCGLWICRKVKVVIILAFIKKNNFFFFFPERYTGSGHPVHCTGFNSSKQKQFLKKKVY